MPDNSSHFQYAMRRISALYFLVAQVYSQFDSSDNPMGISSRYHSHRDSTMLVNTLDSLNHEWSGLVNDLENGIKDESIDRLTTSLDNIIAKIDEINITGINYLVSGNTRQDVINHSHNVLDIIQSHMRLFQSLYKTHKRDINESVSRSEVHTKPLLVKASPSIYVSLSISTSNVTETSEQLDKDVSLDKYTRLKPGILHHAYSNSDIDSLSMSKAETACAYQGTYCSQDTEDSDQEIENNQEDYYANYGAGLQGSYSEGSYGRDDDGQGDYSEGGYYGNMPAGYSQQYNQPYGGRYGQSEVYQQGPYLSRDVFRRPSSSTEPPVDPDYTYQGEKHHSSTSTMTSKATHTGYHGGLLSRTLQFTERLGDVLVKQIKDIGAIFTVIDYQNDSFEVSSTENDVIKLLKSEF